METTTATKLVVIATKARDNPRLRFTALTHHLTVDYLLSCWHDLKRNKAPGIDNKTKESYSTEEVTQTLTQMVADMKARRWKPQPVKRVLIKKLGSNQKRPLGLPTIMDKALQLAMKNILEAIFEPLFLNCSFGFRPSRNAHQALKEVNHMIMQKKINWIIDADIKGFFDHLDHYWLMECLSQRIADPRFKSLIWKFLKAGVLQDGAYQPTDEGTPQGSAISPILANIYLHYVLDPWFEKVARKQIKGDAQLIRYADDFMIGVQYKDQAEKLLALLKDRLAKFNLTLAEDKTRIIEFGRFARINRQQRQESRPGTFDFLGFTHYCTTTRDGRFKLGTKTSRKRLNRSLTGMNTWLKASRNRYPLKALWQQIGVKLQGHYQYYGISGNFASLHWFYYRTVGLAYKWLNRRSWKKSFYWAGFYRYLEAHPLPIPKLTFQIYHTW